ncbi:30S ribosomal protein S13 [Candidatus Woesearchaeota archaeon]|nr:30S ribosomal protein S13 [Candidatus Woesearchaeota archaeon]
MAEKEFRHLVRIANTDLKGEKPIGFALRNIKGVNFQLANAVCNIANIDKLKKVGELSDDEINKLDGIVKDPLKSGVPVWLANRRKDIETGEDKHIITNDLMFTKDNDIKMMRKIKSYKGMRHSTGHPVRGQRTKSNFRKSKGKVMGVKRKAGAKSGRT